MKIDILTPEKKVFEGEAESINLPTPLGFITILPHHISFLSAVSKGRIKIKTQDNQEKVISSYGGIIEVFKNKAVLLLRRYEE